MPLRVLFSAHGLPEVIIKSGDPYQFQIERTRRRVVRALAMPDLDCVVCYQSRATPQKWLGPSTEAEIDRAAHDKVALLVVPIAFVSEHSETLVELDVEYRDWPSGGRAGLFPRAGPERRSRLHRRRSPICRPRRGPACAASPAPAPARAIGDCPHARAGAAPTGCRRRRIDA